MTAYTKGDVVEIEGMGGVWMVVADEAEQVGRNKTLVGTVRVQKVFDGAGPSHLSAIAKIEDLREAGIPVVEQPEAPQDGGETYGVAFTAANGPVVVPMHPRAYASPDQVNREADSLQNSNGLPRDSYLVTFTGGEWIEVDQYKPSVPDTMLGQVAHNHAYCDDGETMTVGPCRTLRTCMSSLLMAEARKQRTAGQPRFADLGILDAPRAEEGGDPVEYGVRLTLQGELRETVIIIPGLAAAAHAVALNRELQTASGDPVDAVLIGRRPMTLVTEAGPWHVVEIGPGVVGEPRKLIA